MVVTNQSANATLALGASPIMATAPEEMADLSLAIGSLLVNFGTIKDKESMLIAGKLCTRFFLQGLVSIFDPLNFSLFTSGHSANLNKKPVIFDPVGVGATAFRRTTANGKSTISCPVLLLNESHRSYI